MFERISSGSDEEYTERDFLFHKSLSLSATYRIDEGYGVIGKKKYSCIIDRGVKNGYYLFTNESIDTSHLARSDNLNADLGWKIHICLKDFKSVVNAWNRIAHLFFEYEVFKFKIRTEHPILGMNFQPGKDIVLYISNSPIGFLGLELLIKIETILCSVPEIIPGSRPRYRIGGIIFDGSGECMDIPEPQIPGSRFMYIERDDILLCGNRLYREQSPHPGADMLKFMHVRDLAFDLGPCKTFELTGSNIVSADAGDSRPFERIATSSRPFIESVTHAIPSSHG